MMCVHGTVPVFCLRFEVLDDGKEDITDDEEGECSHDGRAGMVRTQAETIWRATFQWTALTRWAAPTPMIDPDTTWVVDTGR